MFSIVGGAIVLLVLSVAALWQLNDQRPHSSGAAPVKAAEIQPQIKRLTNQGRVQSAALSPDDLIPVERYFSFKGRRQLAYWTLFKAKVIF